MDIIDEIITFCWVAVIDNLFISLLFVKLFSRFFAKDAYPVSKQIIRWLIIGYAVISILSWIAAIIVDEKPFSERATGPYAAGFWLLVFFSCVLPLTLLLNKVKHNGWAILLIALFVNLGRHIEWLAFMNMSGNGWMMGLTLMPLIGLFRYGILLPIFITGISILVTKYRKKKDNF
ncbi:hypothetical protein ACLI09_03555 [Flavobacterium sp. RHBU_24]|uniref:hypothetical protein n=1 Tax=Flavobacterium sp. RHBU_24 TaxID=3391185 RepID=UPI0039851D6A